MTTKSYIARENHDGSVSRIYCHFDGYLEGVGNELRERYTDRAKVDELIAQGELWSLGAEIGEKHSLDDRSHDWCTFYRRDLGDASCGAHRDISVEAFERAATRSDAEFLYLFRLDGRWCWRKNAPRGVWSALPGDAPLEPVAAAPAALAAPAVEAPAPRGAELSSMVPRDTWRVVADDGRTYAASVLEPAGRGDYHHARMCIATRTAEKRATTARRAVCLAAMDLGLGVVEIRAPGELTKDDAVEAFSRVACEAIEGA